MQSQDKPEATDKGLMPIASESVLINASLSMEIEVIRANGNREAITIDNILYSDPAQFKKRFESWLEQNKQGE